MLFSFASSVNLYFLYYTIYKNSFFIKRITIFYTGYSLDLKFCFIFKFALS
nr:MAG TPA: hypothetical protein [Caudoviricetes sp.]